MLSSKVSEFKLLAILASLMSLRAYSRRASRSDSVRPDGVVGAGVGGGLVRFRATIKTAAMPIESVANRAIQTNRREQVVICRRASSCRRLL